MFPNFFFLFSNAHVRGVITDLTLNSYENRTFWAWNSGFFTGFFTREKGTFFDPGPCLVVKIIIFFAHMIRFEHTYR